MAGKRIATVRITDFDLPLEIEHGKHGVYVTSPLIKGMFIAVDNEEEALREVPRVLADLAKAALP